MAGPYADQDLSLRLTGDPVSASYLDITMDVMSAFGADIRYHEPGTSMSGLRRCTAGDRMLSRETIHLPGTSLR